MAKLVVLVSAVIASALGAAGEGTSNDAREAAQVFQLAESICAADGGRLWGRSLCGPMLLVDSQTRVVFANRADAEGHLKPHEGVFTGQLPEGINVANTAIAWAGVRWTMLMLPLPNDPSLRRILLAHEMWHRVQPELGFSGAEASNAHLDTRDGRYWLQLEWRALAAALRAPPAERNEPMRDAVLFRARRREIFPPAANAERALEMNEGLAEYTGVKLGGGANLMRFVADHQLRDAPQKPSFVRSFAYATGPAYGLLLDAATDNWRAKLTKDTDLAALLTQSIHFTVPAETAALAAERAGKYGGPELAKAEDDREEERRARVANYRARFIEGPVLTIPLQKMNMQFDPGNLVPLEARGTVYPNIRIVDEWGVLTVTHGGALMSSDFTGVIVPAPVDLEARPLQGDGWTLELKAGWKIRTGKCSSDYILRRNE